MSGLFAETALAAIEFPAALRCLSPYAVTRQGAARIAALRPTTDRDTLDLALARVDALRRLFDDGEDIAPVACGEPESALSRLQVDGAVLEGAELVALQRLMESVRLTAVKLRRAAKSAPVLDGLRMPDLPEEPESALAAALEPDGRVKDTASRDLARVRRELVEARAHLVATLERLLGTVDPRHRGEGAGVTLRAGRYVVPVRHGGRAKLGGIVHDESATHATVYVEPPEAIELNNRLRALDAEESREVQRVLRELTGGLRPLVAQLDEALAALARADDYQARARWASATHAARPATAPPGTPPALRQAAHPLLVQPGVAVVRFDFVLEAGERTVLVSGPNTGGKTVLLKAVGLLVALVQCGVMPPLGEGSVVPMFDRLFADIGDQQSIEQSLSTFSAHVAHLRAVLADAGPGSLVLVDELGTGTDPAEGAALAAASLLALTRRGAVTLATTHLGALKDLAGESPGIVNASLQFDAATLAPTYRFVKGVPGRSYGLAIARRLGVEPAVLAEAEGRVSEAERRLDAMLAAAEARGQALEAQADALAAKTLEAENLAARLAVAERALAERADDLERREKEFARRGKAGMREFLLAARTEVERALAEAREGREKEARRALEERIAALAAAESGGADGVDAAEPATPTDAGEGPALDRARIGQLVRIRSLGIEGTVESARGNDVTVLVRGRRVRVKLRDLSGAGAAARA